MNDSTKALLGTVAALAAFVAVFAIMASCSVSVAKVQTEAVDCVKGGGIWHVDDGPNPAHCEEQAAHR